jgi:hypothetical protein
VAQLFSLGHETVLGFTSPVWLAKIRAVRVEMRRHSTVSLGLGSRLVVRTDRAARRDLRASFFMELLTAATASWPNKSPEPTAVGAGSSAIAVHVASRRWLSFFR